MLEAYRAEAAVQPDGTLQLDNLPFVPGEQVEVLVLRRSPAPDPLAPLPSLQLDRFEPAEIESWNVIGQSRW